MAPRDSRKEGAPQGRLRLCAHYQPALVRSVAILSGSWLPQWVPSVGSLPSSGRRQRHHSFQGWTLWAQPCGSLPSRLVGPPSIGGPLSGRVNATPPQQSTPLEPPWTLTACITACIVHSPQTSLLISVAVQLQPFHGSSSPLAFYRPRNPSSRAAFSHHHQLLVRHGRLCGLSRRARLPDTTVSHSLSVRHCVSRVETLWPCDPLQNQSECYCSVCWVSRICWSLLLSEVTVHNRIGSSKL